MGPALDRSSLSRGRGAPSHRRWRHSNFRTISDFHEDLFLRPVVRPRMRGSMQSGSRKLLSQLPLATDYEHTQWWRSKRRQPGDELADRRQQSCVAQTDDRLVSPNSSNLNTKENAPLVLN